MRAARGLLGAGPAKGSPDVGVGERDGADGVLRAVRRVLPAGGLAGAARAVGRRTGAYATADAGGFGCGRGRVPAAGRRAVDAPVGCRAGPTTAAGAGGGRRSTARGGSGGGRSGDRGRHGRRETGAVAEGARRARRGGSRVHGGLGTAARDRRRLAAGGGDGGVPVGRRTGLPQLPAGPVPPRAQ
ncbi:hypothetical protein B9W64_12800 [Streptomyces sp. CS159]|nr:hypothetical protein B9W64_12800 [Streptomyces sp. CS159]